MPTTHPSRLAGRPLLCKVRMCRRSSTSSASFGVSRSGAPQTTSTRRLDSREAYVGVVRLVDLLSADGIWDGVHRRAAAPEGWRLRPDTCTSGPLGTPCAACIVEACEMPEQHDAALVRLRSCACRACAAGRALLARMPFTVRLWNSKDGVARGGTTRHGRARLPRPRSPATGCLSLTLSLSLCLSLALVCPVRGGVRLRVPVSRMYRPSWSMGRPLELLCLYFFACEQRYMRSATPTLSPFIPLRIDI